MRAVVDLFTLLIENLLNAPEKVAHGAEGYYFAENGEHSHRELAEHLGQALYELGAVESPEPVRFLTQEEVDESAQKVSASRSEPDT